MQLQFVKLSPNENMTLLITSTVPREKQFSVANALIAYQHVYAEQAGFLEAPTSPKAQARLQMMAGEFCGNATLSLSSYLFSKQNPKTGDTQTFVLEVSGTPQPVTCTIEKQAKGYWGTLHMPLPLWLKDCCYTLADKTYTFPTISFGGIVHILVPASTWGAHAKAMAEQAAQTWQTQIDADAFGILLFDETKHTLAPLVCVKGASLIWERGCGSGTTAVGAALALREKKSLSLSLQQAGGTMRIEAKYEHGRLQDLILGVHIDLVAEGTAYLEENEKNIQKTVSLYCPCNLESDTVS